MHKQFEHAWDVTASEAIKIQKQLAAEVIAADEYAGLADQAWPQTVAGVDVGFEDSSRVTRAAVVVLSFPDLELLEKSLARAPTTFPYVPGLLSFREGPAILEALDQLSRWPALMLFDGQGIAHPRRLGIASHIGVLTDTPSIGVAKSRLWGRPTEPLGLEKGAWVPLRHGQDIVGAALRTRANVKPLYVSPGHRVSLETAIHYVMACTTRFKLPETTRWAHRLASG